jgi:hypothetical protein
MIRRTVFTFPLTRSLVTRPIPHPFLRIIARLAFLPISVVLCAQIARLSTIVDRDSALLPDELSLCLDTCKKRGVGVREQAAVKLLDQTSLEMLVFYPFY